MTVTSENNATNATSFGDISRGGAIHLTPGQVPSWRPEDLSAIKTIESSLRYVEDTFALIIPTPAPVNAPVRRAGVAKMSFAEAMHAMNTLGQAYGSCAIVTLACRDGFVLTKRASWVASSPNETFPVCESANTQDIFGDTLDYVSMGYRALHEELGLAPDQHTLKFQRQVLDEKALVGVSHSQTSLRFDEVVDCWRTASHADEGEPLLVDLMEHNRFLAKAFPSIFRA